MKKLLFIGFDFHKRTGSVQFLLRIFESEYDVEICYVDLLGKTPWTALSRIKERDVDTLVCFQVMPPRSELNQNITFKHGVFFPMFDGCPNIKKPEKWYPFRDFQIISFSKTLDNQLRSIGLCSHAIQYFPKPIKPSDFGKIDSLFFWNRREKINVNTVACLLKDSGIKNVHVHKVLDPGNIFVEPDDENCQYSFSSWYETREEMQADMQSAALYMAPREKEGIGMSFLEAMAMGRCVVAPDYPTMNEYIKHGETGYLYNLKKPKNLQIKNVREMQKNVIQYMEKGYEEWESRKMDILKWSREPVKIFRIKLAKALFLRFLRNPYKLTKFLIWASKNERRV